MQINIKKNLITIRDYLFDRPKVIRDKKRLLLKSVYVKTEKEQTHYYVDIILGVYTDEELIKICAPESGNGGCVYRPANGIIKVTIYNDRNTIKERI